MPPYKSSPYSNVPQATADPRQVEGWALAEMARRMNAAQVEPVNVAQLLQTVRTNWRLWTIIQANLLEPDCPVPLDIRGNVLSLSAFVDRHTVGIIADPQPGKLDVLIQINREIAAGLMAQPPTASAAKAAPPPPSSGPIDHQA